MSDAGALTRPTTSMSSERPLPKERRGGGHRVPSTPRTPLRMTQIKTSLAMNTSKYAHSSLRTSVSTLLLLFYWLDVFAFAGCLAYVHCYFVGWVDSG